MNSKPGRHARPPSVSQPMPKFCTALECRSAAQVGRLGRAAQVPRKIKKTPPKRGRSLACIESFFLSAGTVWHAIPVAHCEPVLSCWFSCALAFSVRDRVSAPDGEIKAILVPYGIDKPAQQPYSVRMRRLDAFQRAHCDAIHMIEMSSFPSGDTVGPLRRLSMHIFLDRCKLSRRRYLGLRLKIRLIKP